MFSGKRAGTWTKSTTSSTDSNILWCQSNIANVNLLPSTLMQVFCFMGLYLPHKSSFSYVKLLLKHMHESKVD